MNALELFLSDDDRGVEAFSHNLYPARHVISRKKLFSPSEPYPVILTKYRGEPSLLRRAIRPHPTPHRILGPAPCRSALSDLARPLSPRPRQPWSRTCTKPGTPARPWRALGPSSTSGTSLDPFWEVCWSEHWLWMGFRTHACIQIVMIP